MRLKNIFLSCKSRLCEAGESIKYAIDIIEEIAHSNSFLRHITGAFLVQKTATAQVGKEGPRKSRTKAEIEVHFVNIKRLS